MGSSERNGNEKTRREPPVRSWPLHALLVSVVTPLAALLGCTYSFHGSSMPSHIKTIAVVPFRNRTLEPGVETQLTNAVVDVFADDSRIRLGNPGDANAVVEGEVVGYDHGLGNETQAQEYRVTIRLSVVVKDRVKGKDLWKEPAMVAQEAYHLLGTGEGPRNEREARDAAVAKLVEDILSNTLEDW
jgi:hypothetical protein